MTLSIAEKFVLTPKEAGQYIGISECTIRTLCGNGDIPAARNGRDWKIAKPLLERWIMEKCERGEQIT